MAGIRFREPDPPAAPALRGPAAAPAAPSSTELVQGSFTTPLGSTTPLASSPAREGAAWTELGRTVTLNFAITVDTSEHLARVPLLLVLFKFCFAEIFVVIDVPHGGCNYGFARLSGGPQTYSAFIKSRAKDELLQAARAVLANAALLHRHHGCLRPLETRIEIVDYPPWDKNELIKEVFNTSHERPQTASQRSWPYAYMFKNTMSYIVGMRRAKGELILRLDDDFAAFIPNNTGIFRFMSAAIQEFDQAQDVVFVTPTGCPFTRNWEKYKEEGGVRFWQSWGRGRHRGASYVSTQHFVIHKERFRRLRPMWGWRHFPESVFQVAVSKSGVRSVWLEVPGFCKSGFNSALALTPLTPEERGEARAAVRHFSSNAKREAFDPSGRHGRCKGVR